MTKSKEQSLLDAQKYGAELRWKKRKKKRDIQSQVQKNNGSKAPEMPKKQLKEESRRKARRWARKCLRNSFAGESVSSAEEPSFTPPACKKEEKRSETFEENFEGLFGGMSINEDEARADREEVIKKRSWIFAEKRDGDRPFHQSSPRTRTDTSYSLAHQDTNKVDLAADRRKVNKARELKRKAAKKMKNRREEELAAKMKYEADQAEKLKDQASAANEVLRAHKIGDYYRVLGLSKAATQSAVRRAYRRLALKLHPDKCKALNAEDSFKAINEANGVLSCPTERAKFDRNTPSGTQSYNSHRDHNGRRRRQGHHWGW